MTKSPVGYAFWGYYFRAGFQKRFIPGATIRDTLARYLQVRDWDPVRDVCDHAHQLKI